MLYTSLNHIVKSVLNQKGYTMHWYFQYLKYAADCLRELHFDTLKIVQTKKLPVTDYNAVILPCDYVDYVKVGVIYGQQVTPLVQHGGINRLNNYDDAGNKVLWGNSEEDNRIWSHSSLIYDGQNWFGEYLGREFGYKDSGLNDGFKVLPERGEIQLSEKITADYIILEYISDGTGLPDAATKIDPYAQRAIETYVIWKGSQNRDNPASPEAEAHYAQLRILRARKNKMTVDDIRRAINRNKQASPK